VVPGLALIGGGIVSATGSGITTGFSELFRRAVPRVGLAWASQRIPEVPVDAWDVPVTRW